MTLTPTEDNVIIAVDEVETKTTAGLVIPGGVGDGELRYGTIRACGPGRTTDAGNIIPMPCVAADRVIFNPRNGAILKHDSREYLIMRAIAILAVVE